jgi:ATP-dependent Lon protease
MELPEIIAVMPLGQVVFFPHMLLPLHIFEPRYRRMLEDSLTGSRMFAVSGTDASGSPLPVGTVGLVRACVRQPDGTANLLLQGLRRVRLTRMPDTTPYLTAKPEPLHQYQPANHQAANKLANEILRIVNQSTCSCQQLINVSGGIPDYDSLVDIFAGNLVHCPRQKQQLLECEDTLKRLSALARNLRAEYANP